MRIEPRVEKDPFTARDVMRVTETTADAHSQYAFNCPFSLDGTRLFYPSNRTGRWELWCAHLETWEHQKLTADVDIEPFSAYTCPPSGRTYYATRRIPNGIQTNGLWRVSPNGGPPELLVDAGASNAGVIRPNRFETHAVFTRQDGPDSFVEMVDLTTKKVEIIHHARDTVFGHPAICPTDADTVLMSRYGSYQDLREQRMWLWKRAWGEIRPINRQPNWGMVGHEFWMPDGNEIVYFRYAYKDRTRIMPYHTDAKKWPDIWRDGINPHDERLEFGIGFFDVRANRETRWFAANCWHPTPSWDGTRVIMDGSYPPQEITRLDPRTGDAVVLCTARVDHLPDNNQLSHPHPSSSPDNRWVVFTSNRTGRSAVYLVEQSGVPPREPQTVR